MQERCKASLDDFLSVVDKTSQLQEKQGFTAKPPESQSIILQIVKFEAGKTEDNAAGSEELPLKSKSRR